jgi:hypothetical protein
VPAICDGGFTQTALRLADALKLVPGAAVLKHLGGECFTCPEFRITTLFQHSAGKQNGALCQILRRLWLSAQNCKDITRLERGTDPTADRLATIRCHDLNVQAECCTSLSQPVGKSFSGTFIAHLGRSADWDVDERMRRACGHLLGEDGCHKLSLAV